MLESLVAIAHDAGRCALGYFEQRAGLPVSSKAHMDLVTDADLAVEALVVRRLLEAFPDDGILGEEGSGRRGRSGRTWVIDPIDGTFNFIRGGAQWAVSIGLFDGERPTFGVIHAPRTGTTLVGGGGVAPLLDGKMVAPLAPFMPERGAVGVGFSTDRPAVKQAGVLRFLMDEGGFMVRSCNSAVMAMLEVVTGETDAYLAMDDSSWDVMGAWPALEALGARATLAWDKTSLTTKLRFAIGKPDAIEQLAGIFDRRGNLIDLNCS